MTEPKTEPTTEPTIAIPQPPQLLPQDAQDAWKNSYEAAFRQAQQDFPDNPAAHRQTALRAANAVLQVKEPKGYRDAKDLEQWRVLHREEKDQVLRVVTIDGKRYAFDSPQRGQPQSPPQQQQQQQQPQQQQQKSHGDRR